tara:strand:- start:177 stop:344 length:168 start_codon:yes stop_codon:yes gene_type:complete
MELGNADKPKIKVFIGNGLPHSDELLAHKEPWLQGVFIHPAAAKSIYRVSSTLNS